MYVELDIMSALLADSICLTRLACLVSLSGCFLIILVSRIDRLC